jgi:hypothetical protein
MIPLCLVIKNYYCSSAHKPEVNPENPATVFPNPDGESCPRISNHPMGLRSPQDSGPKR